MSSDDWHTHVVQESPIELDPTVFSTNENAAAALMIPRAASLYVGDLASRVDENDLIELFRDVGVVLSVRVCRDLMTQESLGYGYVNFENHDDAEAGLTRHNFESLYGRQIRVMWQQRDPSLRISGKGNVFVKNIPTETDHKGLHELFAGFGSILSCRVIKDSEGRSLHYGYVHFSNDSIATVAIQQMNGKYMDGVGSGMGLYVANFLRRNARLAILAEVFTNIYMKNLNPNVSTEQIQAFFARFGGIQSVICSTDAHGRKFAFCNFDSHDSAVKCIEGSHESQENAIGDKTNPLYVQRAMQRYERLISLKQLYMKRTFSGLNLYVRGFPPDTTDEQLRALFSKFGNILSACVAKDNDGNQRGFGFVSFEIAEQANAALKDMTGRIINGKPLMVTIAQRRDYRQELIQAQLRHKYRFFGGSKLAPTSQRLVPAKLPRPTVPTLVVAQKSVHTVAPSNTPKPVQPKATPASADPRPLNMAMLQRLTEAKQRDLLGERIFIKVHEWISTSQDPKQTGMVPKITGMLLELKIKDMLELLADDNKLQMRIEEAKQLLQESQLTK